MTRVRRPRPDAIRSIAATTHIYLFLLDHDWDRIDDDERRRLLRRALGSARQVVPALVDTSAG
jgi:hypothetical protein